MHKLLERQLARAGIPEGGGIRLLEPLKRLIQAVDDAYRQADVDRRMLERSLELTSKELTQRNADLRQTAQQLSKQHQQLLALAQSRHIFSGDFQAALQEITETAARTLETDRASIWLLDEARSQIVCIDLFERTQARHSQGTKLIARQYPVYFAALGQERAISASDAWTDFRTTEFLDTYLRPLGIRAMLDAPIRVRGKLVGVACHEHIGSSRAWTLEEQQFAGSIADMIALAIEAAERKKAEQEIQNAYSALRRTQTQLLESEKLAMLGQLAAGIAHELKNPLAIILQGEHYLRDGNKLSTEHVEALDLMREAVMRADKIIRGLLDLARPLSLQIGCHDLNHLIDEALALAVKQHSMKSIDIVKDFTRESAKVSADQGQIQQVFINLICNSAQAMPQGGRLTLRTYPKQVKETDSGVGRRATDFFRVGERVIVCEIEDTGTGIAADKISKIFNPFFTTKPRGEGTGLGLSVVRTVVEAHRGLLSVRSQEGHGTLFTIVLPSA